MSRPESARILLLEDDAALAHLATQHLERAGFHVLRPVSGHEALSFLAQKPVDLIVLDTRLPDDSDGLDFLHALRQAGHELPVVLLLEGNQDVLARAQQAGVREILPAGAEHIELLPQAVSRVLVQSRTQRQLLDSEDQLRLFRTALEQETSSIIITDARPWPQGPRVQFVNAAFTRTTGVAAEEALGRSLWEVWNREREPGWIAEVERQVLRGEPYFGAGAYERKDGTTIHMGWHINPIRNAQGNITHFISVQRDISERHRTQEQIREQAALLEQVREAIILCDLDGKVVYWSKGAERMYGWRTVEALGASMRDLLFAGATNDLDAIAAGLLADGEWEGEFRQVTRAGRDIVVDSRLTLLRHEDGRPRAQLAVNTDVTERKKLQTQTLRAQRLESIGTLAGGIAHDLNNVLTPLLLGVEILQSSCQEPGMKTVLDSMQKTVRRGADMVKQILLFARGLESRPMPLQLSHLVSDVERLLGHTLPKSIAVHTDVARDLWMVMGDLTQLHQVLMNLCVNARDAMPLGGSLTISAANASLDKRFPFDDPSLQPGKYVALHVADTGAGIPEEHRDRIFDPFFTTKEPGKGTGLGLSTALGIVQTHQGFIRCYSEPGKGTRFSVYLPAIEVESDAQKKQGLAHVPLGRAELVLVVDDEQSIRAVLTATLESYGYRVLVAQDGRDAVTSFSQHQGEVRAVVTDMMMPGMDGPELVRTLRRLEPDLKIIGMSGLPGSLPVDGAGRPVDAMLQKPCLARELLIALRKVLGTG